LSEENLKESLVDFANALEAMAVNLKMRLSVNPKQESPDFSKLVWTEMKGEKGPYQMASKQNNSNNPLWQELQKKLKEHNGFFRDKHFKYWFHQQDENVIDRRMLNGAK
jgi:hypothetical protein